MLTAYLAAAMLLTQGTQQFDLVCNGTKFTSSDRMEPKSEPFAIRYRIDLSRNLWCASDCRIPQAMKDVTDTELVMEDSVRTSSQLSMEFQRRVDRMSGDFSIIIVTTAPGMNSRNSTSGSCEVAPYSTIPERRF